MDIRRYFTRTNPEMRRVLRLITRRNVTPVIAPLDLVSDAIFAEFEQHDGSVFLATSAPTDSYTPTEYLINRSCWEQWHNRIELGWGLPTRHRGPELVKHGIAVAEALRLKLRSGFPRHRFCLHVAWNSRPAFQSRSAYEQTRKCTISFWQLRPREIVFDAIEEFKHDAIGELVVGR